jgi:hypothetical protein
MIASAASANANALKDRTDNFAPVLCLFGFLGTLHFPGQTVAYSAHHFTEHSAVSWNDTETRTINRRNIGQSVHGGRSGFARA